MKIRLSGTQLLHADGQTDKHDEANTRLSQVAKASVCFMCISQRTAAVAFSNINWCLSKPKRCVYCAVRTGCLYVIQIKYTLKGRSVALGSYSPACYWRSPGSFLVQSV
jgi:hypothetical protein